MNQLEEELGSEGYKERMRVRGSRSEKWREQKSEEERNKKRRKRKRF